MFDDDLFDLTDDPFEWDLLLDDDELEQDRKSGRIRTRKATHRKRMTNAAVDCLTGSSVRYSFQSVCILRHS